LHLKVAKNAIMTPKKFFLKNINMGTKKRKIFMLISNSLMSAFRNVPNKVKSKKPRKNSQNENTQNSHSFLALAFLGAFV
jgi:hypothetical protein